MSIEWAAGLFEGEGYFRSGNRTITVGLKMTDKDVVERFQQTMGCGKIYYQKEYLSHWKDCWLWLVHGDEALRVAKLLQPHLGKRRSIRCAELIAERETKVAAATAPRTCPGCGEEVVNKFKGQNRVYCTTNCQSAAYRRARRAEMRVT